MSILPRICKRWHSSSYRTKAYCRIEAEIGLLSCRDRFAKLFTACSVPVSLQFISSANLFTTSASFRLQFPRFTRLLTEETYYHFAGQGFIFGQKGGLEDRCCWPRRRAAGCTALLRGRYSPGQPAFFAILVWSFSISISKASLKAYFSRCSCSEWCLWALRPSEQMRWANSIPP